MSDIGSSAASQLRLASELRRLRRRARLTGKNVATELGWSEAKLSRIENGQTRVKIADLHQFMDLYGVFGQDRAALVALAEESRETDVLAELEGDVPEGHRGILEAETEAEAIWVWEPQIIPGLLQIENYTRSLLGLWSDIFARPVGEIERRLSTIQIRRRVLARSEPLELSFVIDESVLLRAVASPQVMREQLAHLIENSERQNIELRVLPLNGEKITVIGGFNYFRFPRIHGISRPDTVAFEYMQGTTFTESELDVNSYKLAFSAMRDMSLSQEDSRGMLATVAHETWR
jgi:transcriptional regulator with XRE-family HTH domain